MLGFGGWANAVGPKRGFRYRLRLAAHSLRRMVERTGAFLAGVVGPTYQRPFEGISAVATMDDVARVAGVSRSTVSYVLSGTRPISDTTRERVLRAMRELDYAPNVLAQGLAGSRTGMLALVHPIGASGINLTEVEYIKAAAEQARAEGYNLLLWPYGVEDIDEIRRAVSQGLVDGVLLMEISMLDERVSYLQAADVPFVMIGHTSDAAGLAYIDTDFEATGRIAVEHLAGLGHTSIAFLGKAQRFFDEGHGPVVRIREAIVTAARGRGMDVHAIAAEETFTAGWEAFESLLWTSAETTAVLTINEPGVLGLIAASSKYGLEVPQDLSVLALNSSEAAAQLSRPPLSSVSPDHRAMASLAVSYLVRRLRGVDISGFQSLAAPLLIERGSTGKSRTFQG